MIYLVRLRPFTIEHVALARLIRPFEGIPAPQTNEEEEMSPEEMKALVAPDGGQYKRLIKPFESANLVVDLQEQHEMWFLKQLVKVHPEHIKDFSHFLISPPANILPSEVYDALVRRDKMIPTLCAMHTRHDKVTHIERVDNHHHLFQILHDAVNSGHIPFELSEGLLGSSVGVGI